MGSYPSKYNREAVAIAEEIVREAASAKLTKVGWDWKAPHSLVTAREVRVIRSRFTYLIRDEDLVRFVGLVFSKVLPETHLAFTSDGYHLAIGGRDGYPTIVVKELPECCHGYVGDWRNPMYEATLQAVRSLVEWRLVCERRMNPGEKWPNGETRGGAPFIFGDMYRWIKEIGQFQYCRTRNVIELIYAAVPKLHQEWCAEGLELVPSYQVGSAGRFVALRLTHKQPA